MATRDIVNSRPTLRMSHQLPVGFFNQTKDSSQHPDSFHYCKPEFFETARIRPADGYKLPKNSARN
jgi:hypothetical protein